MQRSSTGILLTVKAAKKRSKKGQGKKLGYKGQPSQILNGVDDSERG